MKHIKSYEAIKNINIEETEPDYYTKHYNDNETFTGVIRIDGKFKDNEYTGKEFKELFMSWYNKIKSHLYNNEKWKVFEILTDWNEECLAKFDLYVLVKKYFEITKITSEYNL